MDQVYLGSLGHALSRGGRGLTATEDANDIDKQGCDSQHAKQHRLWEDDPKESIQRIAARSDESDGDAGSQQHQRILIATFLQPEAVFPMTLEHGHEHRTKDASSPQWRQEPQREGDATTNPPHNR